MIPNLLDKDNTDHTVKPVDYIYIVARGHSGSTLLELLLNGHPQVAAMGEIAKLSLQFGQDIRPWLGRCSCGERPGDCPVWSRIAADVREQFGVDLVNDPFGFRVSPVGLEEDYGLTAPVHWLVHHNHQFWRYAAGRQLPLLRHGAFLATRHRRWAANRFFVADRFRQLHHAQAVVDNSKDPVGLWDLYEHRPAGTRVIFLTRGVPGSVWSRVKRERQSIATAAREWMRVNERTLRLLQRLPAEHWRHVRYEDLCADPQGLLEGLCRFLGLKFDPAMLDLGVKDQHTIGGNLIRRSPIVAIREDTAWKENLSPDDLRQIDRIAGATARKLGYE